MRSPVTRTAAVIALIVGAIWAYSQGVERSGKTPTILSLLNAATATENAWFTGEHTVHIVSQIVISPQSDANDLGVLMEDLESDFDQAKFEAFYRRLLTPRGMEFFSLDPNGHRHNHYLELADPQAEEATIEDHIWYDPGTGRYVRLLTRTERVLFAHSFDGRRVYLAQCDDRGELTVRSDPVTASFSAPENLAGFLGSTVAEVRKLLEVKDILIRREPTDSTLRGKAVRVYKLSYAFYPDERIPYVQLSVDRNDRSFVKIEFITNQKAVLTIDHLSRTQGELPTVGWDLSALPGSQEMPAADVTVRHEVGRSGLSVQEMAERATFPVYIFGRDPHGTLRRTIYEGMDPVSPTDRLYAIVYETQHEVAVALAQCRTLDRFVKAQAKNVDRQSVQPIITTSNGFRVHDLDAKDNAFILNLLFARLNKKAAENRNCHLLESPDGEFMFLGVDGWLPSNELGQLIESLVLAQDYVPNDESLPQTVVDLSLATHSDLESPVIPWLLLGRFDFNVYTSVATDEEARKRAFAEEILDLNAFTPEVRVQGKAYAWTSCYGQTANYNNYGQSINLGAVYGTTKPGICYGRTRIIVSEPTEVVLGIGSPHAVKIWLNGKLIYEVWGPRGAWPNTDLVPITLRGGENQLVFKCLHSHGNEWRFFCHLKEGNTMRYAATKEEQNRGFIAVQGNSRPEPRPRLNKLVVDLGRNERDLVPVSLVRLTELDAVSIGVSGPGAALCTTWVEKEYRLHAGDQASLRLPKPARIWLEVDSHDHDPGVYELTVSLSSDQGTELRIPATVTVHDVALPKERTMGMNPQVGVVGLSWWANYSPEARRRLEVFLDDLAQLRSTVCHVFYTYNPANVLHQVKIAGTDQTLHSAGQAGTIDIDDLPDLDFSFFDPWIAGAARRGMTHLEINGRLRLSEHERAFAKAVLGQEADYSDETCWKTLMWLHSQFRDYAISRGMTETWAKIDTQLTPETIPDYVQTASRYQGIGYRTFTGTTNDFTRETTWLNQLNPQNDAWYMSYDHACHFLTLTQSEQGQAAVPLDAEDQIWYHDGANYNTAYEEGRRKAWRACAIGVRGYTWWTYRWGNSTDQVVWYDQETERIIHSPVWHGLRDGNEDAAYYHMLQQRLQAHGDQAGLARLAALTGKTEDAPLRMITVSYDGLVCDDIAGPIGFHQFNQAKREVLKMLCADQ